MHACVGYNRSFFEGGIAVPIGMRVNGEGGCVVVGVKNCVLCGGVKLDF